MDPSGLEDTAAVAAAQREKEMAERAVGIAEEYIGHYSRLRDFYANEVRRIQGSMVEQRALINTKVERIKYLERIIRDAKNNRLLHPIEQMEIVGDSGDEIDEINRAIPVYSRQLAEMKKDWDSNRGQYESSASALAGAYQLKGSALVNLNAAQLALDAAMRKQRNIQQPNPKDYGGSSQGMNH